MRGFSLIEVAIVLAVISLVLGSIWIAAASVQENRKLTMTAQGIIRMTEGVRKIGKGFTPNQLAGAAAVDTPVSMLVPLYHAGVIPQDVFSPCQASFCEVPWKGGSMQIYAVKRVSTVGDYYLRIAVPSSACIRLAMFLASGDFYAYAIKRIIIGSTTFNSHSEMDTATVTARCQEAGELRLYFLP